ncbi:MAG: hypothetical protein FWE20_10920 [Defluviitaleaceae bacterium]|nr:hypothetical protein [Defluviitaleaceae bacterium]
MTEHLENLRNEGSDGTEPLQEGGFFDALSRINELEYECAARDKQLESLRGKLLDTEIGRRAALMGIPPERAGHIARLANLDRVFGDDGELDDDALGAAIDAVLSDVPELKGGRANGGAFNPRGAAISKSEAYRQQISDANAKGDLLTVVSLKRKARKLGISV